MNALLLTTVLACAKVQGMLPTTAVLDAAEAAQWEMPRPSAAAYTGPHRVDQPVIPLVLFGAYYDLDVVLVSRHPDWDMHEYARVQTPDGPVWLAKDADADKVQTIVGAHPELDTRLAEVPVDRFIRPVEVDDRTEGRNVDLTLSYVNSHGEPVHVSYRGRLPKKPPPERNGNTMGHSARVVSVALDLERFGFGGRARIEIDGERVRLDRILGLVRQRYLLAQAQGGVAVASFLQQPTDDGVRIIRPAAGAVHPVRGSPGWPASRTESWQRSGRTLIFDDGWTRHTLEFVEGGLARATVDQFGREVPVTDLRFQPALPDLSRPFEGEVTSTFRLDINGQVGHGTGTITARSTEGGAVVTLTPTAPYWLADRPLESVIGFRPDGAVLVETRRVE